MKKIIELHAKRPKHKDLVIVFYDTPLGRKAFEKEKENLIRRGYSVKPRITMSNFDELEGKVRHYRWLQGIAAEYEDMLKLINREKDYFTIEGFSYSARGDVRTFNVNSHRTIPYIFIRDGIQAELETIRSEMAECEKEIEGWI